jgi:hypothetical protein
LRTLETPWLSLALVVAAGPFLWVYLRRRNGPQLRSEVLQNVASHRPSAQALAHILFLISALATSTSSLLLFIFMANTTFPFSRAGTEVAAFMMALCSVFMLGHGFACAFLTSTKRREVPSPLCRWFAVDCAMFGVALAVFFGIYRRIRRTDLGEHDLGAPDYGYGRGHASPG